MLHLEPQSLWKFFHNITQIPRPSGKEAHIQSYIDRFAQERGLSIVKDDAGNRVIRKQASPGYENMPGIILQAHMDMVCEKNADVMHDFENDPIKTYVDGDWIKAQGTTLGADNGIGMAYMLAILDDKTLQHPRLECLFTSDEETGLTGALALSNSLLQESILINLDSEDDGEIYVGCAGGIGTKALLKTEEEPVPAGFFGFQVSVSGLKGGHSGGDIHLGLGNALKMLGAFLGQLNEQMDVRLAALSGGNLHNAIPREATARVVIPYAEKETIRVMLNVFLAEMEEKYRGIEPGLCISLESDNTVVSVWSKSLSNKLINILNACAHGVIAMSRDIEGLVETSTNLASVKLLNNGIIEINTSQRSSDELAKNEIAAQIKAVFSLAGAEVIQSDGYPGWKPNLNSDILGKASSAYKKLYGNEPQVKAIHAGLECGLFLEKYPQLDMISIGPQMYGVHSPDERLSIASTQKTHDWLLAILATK
jgi:dipeptidase D